MKTKKIKMARVQIKNKHTLSTIVCICSVFQLAVLQFFTFSL